MSGSGCIGFIDTTLAIFLNNQVGLKQQTVYECKLTIDQKLTGVAAFVRGRRFIFTHKVAVVHNKAEKIIIIIIIIII